MKKSFAENNPPKMSVRTAAIWSMAGQYIVFATHFITSVIVSRYYLTPQEVGLFSTALAAAMMISTFQDFGITRYISGGPELDESKIRLCFSVSLLFAIAIGLVILVLAWPAAKFYHDDNLFSVLVVIAGSYLLVPFSIVPTALLQRRLHFASIFLVNIGSAFAMAIVTTTLAVWGFSAVSLAWGMVAQAAARSVISIWRSGEWPSWPLTLRGAGPIVQFGSESSALFASGAISIRTPELIVGKMLGFFATGLYGRAVGLAGQLRLLVSGAIGAVFLPAFARLRDQGELFAPSYLRVVSAYSVTNWPAMVYLSAAAYPTILLLYGPKWTAACLLVVFIALAEIPATGLPLHMDIPIVLGRMRRLLAYNIAETSVSVITLIAGAMWSIEAAAASRLVYAICWFAIYARFMQELIGFRWQDMIVIYIQSLACSIATVAPLLMVYYYWLRPEDVGLSELAATALAGGCCWAGTLFIVRHPARIELIEMGTEFCKRTFAKSI